MKNKKITFIDILIIVVVIGALIFATQFFSSGRSQTNGSVEFVVLVAEHEKGILNNASIGDTVVIDLTDKYKAEITDIKTQAATITTLDSENNKYVLQNSPLTEDSYITLRADAQIDENIIKVGTSPIRIGQTLPVRGKGYTANGYVVNILSENAEQEG